jgi:hypothetical protein
MKAREKVQKYFSDVSLRYCFLDGVRLRYQPGIAKF